MKEKDYALFGVIGPLIVFITLGVSILLSPWFSWERNALSDLGHVVQSEVAPIFNFGLLLSGFILTIYIVLVFRKYAKYTSISLLASAFFLQLVSTFDEVYGFFHGLVSVLFFMSIGISLILYAKERKSSLALTVFIIDLCSWILYGMGVYKSGIAVPEMISVIPALLLVMYSAIKIYSNLARTCVSLE